MHKEFLSGLWRTSSLRCQNRVLPLVVSLILLLAMSSANSSSWTEYRSEHLYIL